MSETANTPTPPYYAVMFSNQRSRTDDAGYQEMAVRMVELAKQQPGYLGVESVHDETGFGITISYWRDEASIKAWKQEGEHLEAQRLGKEHWYQSFFTRIAKVERDYAFAR